MLSKQIIQRSPWAGCSEAQRQSSCIKRWCTQQWEGWGGWLISLSMWETNGEAVEILPNHGNSHQPKEISGNLRQISWRKALSKGNQWRHADRTRLIMKIRCYRWHQGELVLPLQHVFVPNTSTSNFAVLSHIPTMTHQRSWSITRICIHTGDIHHGLVRLSSSTKAHLSPHMSTRLTRRPKSPREAVPAGCDGSSAITSAGSLGDPTLDPQAAAVSWSRGVSGRSPWRLGNGSPAAMNLSY